MIDAALANALDRSFRNLLEFGGIRQGVLTFSISDVFSGKFDLVTANNLSIASAINTPSITSVAATITGTLAGNIISATSTSTTSLSAGSASVTGALSSGSFSTSSLVSTAATISNGLTVTSGPTSLGGTTTASSLVVTGSTTATTIAATGAVTAPSFAATGTVSAATLSSSGPFTLGGAWNAANPIVLGSSRIWVDGTGNIRFKASAPTKDTDGRALIPNNSSVFINVKDFGAIGNGIADDTAALQAAIDVLSRSHPDQSKPPATGVLYFPMGTYKITSTLEYIGDPGVGFHMYGDQGDNRGLQGSVIVWGGTTLNTGKMLFFRGVNGSLIENMQFNGNNYAKTVFHVDGYHNGVGSFIGASGVRFKNCIFAQAAGPGSVCMLLGNDVDSINWQASEMTWENCMFTGNEIPSDLTRATEAGFRTLVPGNVKNFWFKNCYFDGTQYGLDWQRASGVLHYSGGTMGNIYKTMVRSNGSQFHMQDVEIENGIYPAPGCRFLTSDSDGGQGTILLENVQFTGDLPADNVGILVAGAMTILNCSFYNSNGSNPPGPTVYNEFIVVNSSQRICSKNSIYAGSKDYAPFYDGIGGNSFGGRGVGGDSYYTAVNLSNLTSQGFVSSEGDQGITYTPSIVVTGLRPFTTGTLPSVFSQLQGCNNNVANTNISLVTNGDYARTVYKVTIAPGFWKANALFQDLQLAILFAKTRLIAVYEDITQGFAGTGLTGTISLQLGTSTGGNDLLLSQTVQTTKTIGLVAGDLGTTLSTAANFVQGGYMPTWTGTPYIMARLTSSVGPLGNGTVTNLTAGSVTFYMVLERLP